MSNSDDARAFNFDITKWAEHQVPEEFRKFQIEVAKEAISGVMLRSPVGNPTLWKRYLGRKPAKGRRRVGPPGYVGGRFRNNWLLSLKSTTDQTLKGVDPTGAKATARAYQVLAGIQPFDDVHLQNSLPYAIALEEGHSQQAPQGVVALTLASIETKFMGGKE